MYCYNFRRIGRYLNRIYCFSRLPFHFNSTIKSRAKSRKVSRVTRFLQFSTSSRSLSYRDATRTARYKISMHPRFIRYAACTRREVFNDFAQENCSYRHPEYGFWPSPHAEFPCNAPSQPSSTWM